MAASMRRERSLEGEADAASVRCRARERQVADPQKSKSEREQVRASLDEGNRDSLHAIMEKTASLQRPATRQ
jgi:hypothetical protein